MKFYLDILIPLIYAILHFILFWKFVHSSSSFLSQDWFLALSMLFLLLLNYIFWPACLLNDSRRAVFRIVINYNISLFFNFSCLCTLLPWVVYGHKLFLYFSYYIWSHCILKKKAPTPTTIFTKLWAMLATFTWIIITQF